MREDAGLAVEDALDVRRIRQHRDDDTAGTADVGRGLRNACALVREGLHRRAAPVEHDQGVARGEQAASHGAAHEAETDESNRGMHVMSID